MKLGLGTRKNVIKVINHHLTGVKFYLISKKHEYFVIQTPWKCDEINQHYQSLQKMISVTIVKPIQTKIWHSISLSTF